MMLAREIVHLFVLGFNETQKKHWEKLLKYSSHVEFDHLIAQQPMCSRYLLDLFIHTDVTSSRRSASFYDKVGKVYHHYTYLQFAKINPVILKDNLYIGFQDFEEEFVFLCRSEESGFSFDISQEEISFIKDLIAGRGLKFFTVEKDPERKNHVSISNELNQWIYPLVLSGINLGNMLIQDIKGRKQTFLHQFIPLHPSPSFEGVKVKHNAKRTYFDLDDTIIFKGKKNTSCWQLVLENVRLGNSNILITRHPHELSKTFRDLNLDLSLFDEVIQIKDGTKKSEYICNDENTFFIDNEFMERKDVHERTSAKVFDLDAIEILLFSLSHK